MIFEADDPVNIKYVQKRNYQAFKPEPWPLEGNLHRVIEYNTPLNVPISKENFTKAIEAQTYQKKEDFTYGPLFPFPRGVFVNRLLFPPSSRYVIEVHTSTPNAPYGDTFETQLRYFITYVTKT